MMRSRYSRLFTYLMLFLTWQIGLIGPKPATAAAKKWHQPSMKGTLLIKWDNESRFIYVPDPQDGLRFLTRDGREIRPARMYTDGGSIPRVFWSVKGFSPWGYGPAYVLHDWLFHAHRCGKDPAPNKYSMEQANEVLDDAIKVLIVTKKVSPNEPARRLIRWAVDHFAETAWNEPCDEEPPSALPEAAIPEVTVGRVSFPQ
jgi:uncharacterized protein DUF1353